MDGKWLAETAQMTDEPQEDRIASLQRLSPAQDILHSTARNDQVMQLVRRLKGNRNLLPVYKAIDRVLP